MSTREDAERRYAQIEGERDYHKRRAERLEAERDALAAHVEQMTDAACSEGAGPKMRAAIDEGPATSLARLKAQEAQEGARAAAQAIRMDYDGRIHADDIADFVDEIADDYRRQAEGDAS